MVKHEDYYRGSIDRCHIQNLSEWLLFFLSFRDLKQYLSLGLILTLMMYFVSWGQSFVRQLYCASVTVVQDFNFFGYSSLAIFSRILRTRSQGVPFWCEQLLIDMASRKQIIIVNHDGDLKMLGNSISPNKDQITRLANHEEFTAEESKRKKSFFLTTDLVCILVFKLPCMSTFAVVRNIVCPLLL